MYNPNGLPQMYNNNPNPSDPSSQINQYIPYYMPMPFYQFPPGPHPQMSYPSAYPFPVYPQTQRLPTPFSYSKAKPDQRTEGDEQNNIEITRKKPDPFKNKTSEQIVNEFKAFTLPKLRLHRLIKLQAMIKGWLVRRFVFPRKKLNHRLMKEMVEKKIQELVEVILIKFNIFFYSS